MIDLVKKYLPLVLGDVPADYADGRQIWEIFPSCRGYSHPPGCFPRGRDLILPLLPRGGSPLS